MRRLENALETPGTRSFPKSLRRLEQTEIHRRTEKTLRAPELLNWVTAGYNYGTIMWDKFQTLCSKENWPFTVENFICKVSGYQMRKNAELNNAPEEETIEATSESVSISLVDVVDFSIAMKWFYGNDKDSDNTLNINDVSRSSNRDYIIFHCCEELELLSREHSNDEGGDNAVAIGPQVDTGTEHPDFLIQKGLAQSALHRVPLAQVSWESPLPENTHGLLQKAFPHVFLTGDGDPYQERPRCIREPKSAWLRHYLGLFAE